LTVAGSALLTEAYELVERSRTAVERARGAGPGAEVVTVAAAVCDVVAVTEASRAFERSRPGVRVRVVTRERVSPSDELSAGGADVLFLRDCHDRRGLDIDRLTREPRTVLLPADHPLARRDGLGLSDLREEPVTSWAGMSAREADHWSGADADRRPRRHGPVVRSATDVLAAVVTGRAVAFAHGSTLPDAGLPGLCVRPVDGLSPSCLEIAVPLRGASPAGTAFAQYARERWAGMDR
jgi:DNA-binding transcriptional LysR family regulator